MNDPFALRDDVTTQEKEAAGYDRVQESGGGETVPSTYRRETSGCC